MTDYRELLAGAKQWMKRLELPSEQLPERIFRVGADGKPCRYHRVGYKAFARIWMSAWIFHEQEWYRVGCISFVSYLLRDGGFFVLQESLI